MQYLINDIEPLALFHYFEELSAIPRPSLGEEKVADYLVDFAKKQELAGMNDCIPAENMVNVWCT